MTNFVDMAIAKAINAGLRKAMSEDSKVLVFGQDVAQLGGVFRVTEGIHAEFGNSRIFNSPIAESGIVGTAIGLAMRGYRPVAEIQFDGFIFPAFDQITTQLAKMQNRSEGFHKMPVVIRVPFGGGIGAVEHHSESPEAYFAHTAGLRVVSPNRPFARMTQFCFSNQSVATGRRVRLTWTPLRRISTRPELSEKATT
ncbi:MAG: hypothetical protein RL166_926 [Actinomycetota bacterium]